VTGPSNIAACGFQVDRESLSTRCWRRAREKLSIWKMPCVARWSVRMQPLERGPRMRMRAPCARGLRIRTARSLVPVVGPTASARRSLTKGARRFMFDDDTAILGSPCRKYSEKHSVGSRLSVAPSRLVGMRKRSRVTEAVRRARSVILFGRSRRRLTGLFIPAGRCLMTVA